MSRQQSDAFYARNYLHPRYWPMWLFIGFLRLASLFPYKFLLAFGRLLGKLLKITPGARQSVVDINLELCLPELSRAERRQIKSRCYRNIGISVLETAMCWWWPERRLRPLVEIRGQEHIDAALAGGRGVILLTGHFTSLEIGARLLALFMPVQVMYRSQKNKLFDHFLYSKRSRYFVQTISRKKTRQLIRGIKELVPTWYAPDQNFRKERTVFAPFMGVQTATLTASARLVQSSGGVMLPFYPERKRDGSGYILWIEPPLQDFPAGDDVEDATRINTSIEKFVRRHPGHYMWIHQRFKTRPPGEPGIYR